MRKRWALSEFVEGGHDGDGDAAKIICWWLSSDGALRDASDGLIIAYKFSPIARIRVKI